MDRRPYRRIVGLMHCRVPAWPHATASGPLVVARVDGEKEARPSAMQGRANCFRSRAREESAGTECGLMVAGSSLPAKSA